MKYSFAPTFIALLGTLLAGSAQSQTCITFAPPNSSSTVPVGIDSAGDVAGYCSCNGGSAGFIRFASGEQVVFQVPGGSGTKPAAMNAGGDITGTYSGGGFVRLSTGDYITFTVPGAGYTAPIAIAENGDVTGLYKQDADDISHGFVRSTSGAFTTFDVPNSTGTIPLAISSTAGAVLGYYTNPAQNGQTTEGFEFANGAVTPFNVGRTSSSQTLPAAVNSWGQGIGNVYEPRLQLTRGFSFLGTLSNAVTFSVDGSFRTYPTAVNSVGNAMTDSVVTGYYYRGRFTTHGFLRDSTGTITTFDVPDTDGTSPTGINNNMVITGTVLINGQFHGFLRFP